MLKTPRNATLWLLLTTGVALADPCGMVPPIDPRPNSNPQISRIGVLQTYAFHKGDLETFAIRPGFRGKVEDFGMLISFPTPPSLRKVPDDTFAHIEAAVDPPIVTVYPFQRDYRMMEGAMPSMKAAAPSAGLALEKDEVRVIREEAVGMYEVVVLEAGSASALKRWMDEHKYVFPKGMEAVAEDYVRLGWCFVAERARVGSKKGADPAPGQREVNSNKGPGQTFDGYLQGMEFRFLSKQLLIPMRLSAFNEGSTRNVIYLLSDAPMKIANLPESFVKRQIPGDELFSHVTDPLPLKIVGGTVAECRAWFKQNRKSLTEQLRPEPKNGVAKDIFAGDLLAVAEGVLAHPVEDREKMLLDIGERLDLRGPEIDALNSKALAESRHQIVQKALGDLSGYTLTVLDGEIPRDILAKDNLQFVPYKMSAQLNDSKHYQAVLEDTQNAPIRGYFPRPNLQQDGYLVPKGELPKEEPTPEPVSLVSPVPSATPKPAALISVDPSPPSSAEHGNVWVAVGAGLIGGGLLLGLRKPWAATAVFVGGCLAARLLAQTPTPGESVAELLKTLEDPAYYAASVRALVARGEDAKPPLLEVARKGQSLVQRGFAIACLAEIGGQGLDEEFRKLEEGPQPELVKNWAAAGRVKVARSADEVIRCLPLEDTFPAVRRPIELALVRHLHDIPLAQLLELANKNPNLQQTLAQSILAAGPQALARMMLHSKDAQARQTAAGYLGTLANQGDASVVKAVVESYRFDPEAQAVPWQGGPLYVPALSWNKETARQLIDELVRWDVWAEHHDRAEEVVQVENNLRSIQLWNALGVSPNGIWNLRGGPAWLGFWKSVVGQDGVHSILRQQHLDKDPKYQTLTPMPS